ncbi:ABC transporter substrate-binding protein [Achromobacter insolitus]|jgi:branched-chain amino acid transport system substrate-binding protein|uniref:Leucine-, isoleucine-, valine-, threonine-, and alanine-binding protein n=3 Tax=Pseudomonadota TaxID=1224 RepID=A0A6S7FAR9_9BURK|nr:MULTISPECIES: ABC transporter substrate-binding protein [Achromobacter]APX77500.1 ABC transporter substrate-binding protein [Achromobacter insolitus]AVG42560.1 ABC transporter substrate-binding protein [Achromobacter insolitus]MCP1399913.1 branched-chain amino acid transport system substrate-binding protein [Achromobacter insolitus]MDH3067001.1 ABC transporter substrate-binding protein [Achromobacter insolitus]MEB3094321.1 ABC transporter substrate-binding protein [Achromobacter sp. D10]
MTKPQQAMRPGRREFVAGLGAAALAASLPGRALAAPSEINVGVILPLSGANAQFGINSRQGLELAADEINAAGGIKAMGGAKLKLIIADATSQPTTAATVAQRLITQNRCVAIIGAYASSLTLAVSEVTERRGIPLLTMSFSDVLTERGFKHIFQVVSKGSVLGRAQYDYAASVVAGASDIKKIALLYEDTAYGTSQAVGVRNAAKAAGTQIVLDEAYPLGITDVTPLISKLRGSDAQIVFPISYLNDSLLIIRVMRQQRLTVPIVGGAAGYVIPDFAKALGQYSEAVLSIAPANYDQAPEYTERYRKRFGTFMPHEALEHAVCAGVLAQALEVAASDKPEAVSQALRAKKYDQGWAGVMSGGGVHFDANGLNTMAQPIMVQWQKGELVSVWPQALAKGRIITAS